MLTGELNEIGEMVTSNADSGRSYRLGIELEAAYQIVKWFRWDLNATLSRNRNKDYTSSIYTYNADKEKYVETGGLVNLGETKISYSPDIIFNNFFTFMWKGFRGQIQSQYIGEQNMTNYGYKSASVLENKGTGINDISMILDDYFTTNIDLAYTFNFKKPIKSLTVGCTIYNVFSAKYDNYGWGTMYVIKDNSGNLVAQTKDLYNSGFAPQAPCNVLAHVSINF